MTDSIGPMLALEESLAADTGGTLRDELVGRFADQARQVKRTLDAGVPPAEYQTLSKLLAAYEAAGQVVAKAWNRGKGAPMPSTRPGWPV